MTWEQNHPSTLYGFYAKGCRVLENIGAIQDTVIHLPSTKASGSRQMQRDRTVYAPTRRAWRLWLAKHHASEKEIWLIYYYKASGKPRIPYNDAVEEALCFGWIDSQQKSVDSQRFAQRFSPRRPGTKWSPMNIERLKRLIRQKKVTKSGLEAATDALKALRHQGKGKKLTIRADIMKALKSDPAVWRNFSRFPASYKRIRIGWIEGARKRPGVFEQRLGYFVRMTA